MTNELQQIKNEIAFGRVIVFIGTGVSVYTTNDEQPVANLKGLLMNGLQECYHAGWMTENVFSDLFSKFKSNLAEVNDYLVAADQIKTCFERVDSFELWLTETIGKLSAKKSSLIDAIKHFECPIVTTNYDLLLEQILHKKPSTWFDYDEVNSKTDILHMYGYYEKPDTMIFTNKDYVHIRENKSILSKLNELIQDKILLFIGYGSDMSDPNFSNLLKCLSLCGDRKSLSAYKLVQSNKVKVLNRSADVSFLENIHEIPYGETFDDLVTFMRNLKSFAPFLRDSSIFTLEKDMIRKKYLHYLLNEYAHVSILGSSNTNMSLPLQSVYVELKFDPTHPSIKAMKTLEINEQFKRKLLSPGFFSETERIKINRAIMEKNSLSPETIYRDFMVEQWLNVLLSNRNIFTDQEANAIKDKINRLKQTITANNSLKDAKQYQIQQAYSEFKHFVILGHPGSGKTTLSKWLITNMARQCLGESNMLFNETSSYKEKLPILIPIWKYVDQLKQTQTEQKKTLLQFIYENPTFNSTYFQDDERKQLSLLVIESLIQGNVLVIFEGLDEVPVHVDRSDLMKEMNSLLQRGIDYDVKSGKLSYSLFEQKEIYNTNNPDMGNRFLITSRIEGNYFEEINFYIPRLTIEDMSNDALRLFCNSYMECIQEKDNQIEYEIDQLYDDITKNKDIFQLAINPQIASVIAAVYNQCHGELPDKRIDLYEQAIQSMIERLVSSSDFIFSERQQNICLLWSILQEIAEYLHSKVEGLSENHLKKIIRKYLSSVNVVQTIDESIEFLVDIFKYKAGLLNEFGHDSFRFIHRTFQEYLAAKSIIYFNGQQRSNDSIYENIKSKIDIPNWRVPLNMTFGILSTTISQQILIRLLTNEMKQDDDKYSNILISFVMIDSLNDMYFSSKHTEYDLVQKLADTLLIDYRNLSGFSRLKEHQELIHSYFFKLKLKQENILKQWFLMKLQCEENIAACCHIIYQLKWYLSEFHEIFLNHLHNDSSVWNWPIDNLLRFYSTKIHDQTVLQQLKFKNAMIHTPALKEFLIHNSDWLRLIVALYGGYKNYNTPSTISEYYEIVQFLELENAERAPFIFYYQDIWGQDDPAYNMAVHLDNFEPKQHWNEQPIFDENEIYKETYLTRKILRLLTEKRSTNELLEELRVQAVNKRLKINEQLDTLIALTVLTDSDDMLNSVMKIEQNEYFQHRIEQIIYTLKDPIARCSEYISEHSTEMNLSYKIYLSLIADSGGLPINTSTVAQTVSNIEHKTKLYAEHFASQFTGAKDDLRYQIAVILDTTMGTLGSDCIIKSFLKLSDAIQLYQPIRSYPWCTDQFIFKYDLAYDVPIAFFNCLENLHSNIAFAVEGVCDVLMKDERTKNNPDLIPLIILLYFGVMSKDVTGSDIYERWLPELAGITNIKKALFKKIKAISNPYYRSRGLCQFAQFYDKLSYEILDEAFIVAKTISDPSLEFQVLEKIYNIMNYKNTTHTKFIEQIRNELISTCNSIRDDYNRIIASIRLSFYDCGSFRKKYLTKALELLNTMKETDEKIQLIIKLKPIVFLYNDLEMKWNTIVKNLTNINHIHFINRHYGKILFADQAPVQPLFLLFAQMNDMKSIVTKKQNAEQLWKNLFQDPDNQSNVKLLVENNLKAEIFLTPSVAIVIDELIAQGKEQSVSLLFPYLRRPSHEVMPIVQKWFTDLHHLKLRQLAAVLLCEAKYIFKSAVNTIVDLLETDNDQMRYRAQRIFQHPERDVTNPTKRASIIGEKTLLKIVENLALKRHPPRIRAYLVTFFYDLLWDDAKVFKNLYEQVLALFERYPEKDKLFFFNRIYFSNESTWNTMLKYLEQPTYSTYAEEIFFSTMFQAKRDQISDNQWRDFVRIISMIDTSQFKEKIYFIDTDVGIITFVLDEICASTSLNDDMHFEILQTKLNSSITCTVDDIFRGPLNEVNHVSRCNFNASYELNRTVLNLINNIVINVVVMENLINWLIYQMKLFKDSDSTLFSLMMCDCLLTLVSACAQKEDYVYRKITNSPNFDKLQMIDLLQRMINAHPYFPARGSAFILLVIMDEVDHQIIIHALNTLFDENLVKEYAVIGIPLIHLSPNEFIDDLLKSLKNESAIKAYQILKILTQFALDEKIDAKSKTKILNYLAKEIGQLKSKKPVSYYYTDIKIPFTTTLENELYKAWIKIQGLSGKTQYTAIKDNN